MLLAIILIISILCGGGFYTFIYGAAGIAEAALLSLYVYKKKTLRIPWSGFGLAIAVCGVFSILVPLWAVDGVMAWDGTVRMITVGLFFLLIMQEGPEISSFRRITKDFLHIISAVTVIISLILSLIPATRDYVLVSGRLGGSFMYPNTYALFLLVSMIAGLAVISGKIKHKSSRLGLALDICSVALCLVGFVLTGSRGAFLVAFIILVLALIIGAVRLSSKSAKILCGGVAVALLLCIGIGAFFLFNKGVDPIRLSTMWGRMLYDIDALRIIASHPQGLGYYGYYFIQGSMQSGVYSVVNVHNEYLQLLLDLGVVPGLFLFGTLVVKLVKAIRDKSENRQGISVPLIITAVALHSFIDYDMQFLPMVMIALLMITDGDTASERVRNVDIKVPGQIGFAVLAIIAVVFFGKMGLCDLMYVSGHSEAALAITSEHTMALKDIMISSDDETALLAADSVLSHNKYDTISNLIKARTFFSEGDIQRFIEYERKAMETSPYDISIYEEYLTLLDYVVDQYVEMGDMDSAAYAVRCMQEIPEELERLRDRTSPLAFMIKDQPQLSLDDTYVNMIEIDINKVDFQ